jgi:hypothetical protein
MMQSLLVRLFNSRLDLIPPLCNTGEVTPSTSTPSALVSSSQIQRHEVLHFIVPHPHQATVPNHQNLHHCHYHSRPIDAIHCDTSSAPVMMALTSKTSSLLPVCRASPNHPFLFDCSSALLLHECPVVQGISPPRTTDLVMSLRLRFPANYQAWHQKSFFVVACWAACCFVMHFRSLPVGSLSLFGSGDRCRALSTRR